MADVYSEYKPLRNYLRKVDLVNSLGACRWYINYFQLKNPPKPPSDLQVDPILYKDGFRIFLPWQLAVLAREIIIEGQLSGSSYDMRRPKDLASGLNKVKAIDNYIGEHYVNQGNVYHVFSKVMAHQQFMWQENRPNYQTTTRYYAIYQHPKVRPIFEKFFGLTVERYFVFSLLALGNYNQFLGLTYPPRINLKQLGGTQADYDLFIKHYALPLEELRKRLTDPAERHIDSDFLYYFDSLKRFPMVLTEVDGTPTHLCPVPTYLFWRTTDGIYYELVNEKGFDQALGEAYKSYIGDVLQAQPYPRPVQILDADTYVQTSLPKPDWIVVDADHAAFIECKAKRMTVGAKSELNFTPITEGQLQKLAESVIQCYKAIQDAMTRNYKDLAQVKHYHPIVVTLETWYVFGDTAAQLEKLVMQEAAKEGVDTAFIKANPYLAISSYEMETLTAILRKKSVAEVIPPFFSDQKFHGWQFDSYIHEVFKNERKGYKVFSPNPLDKAIEKMSGNKIKLDR